MNPGIIADMEPPAEAAVGENPAPPSETGRLRAGEASEVHSEDLPRDDRESAAVANPRPPQPDSAAHGEPREAQLLDLLLVLAQGKRIVLQTTMAAALLAGIVALLLPNRYTATVSLLPPQQSPSLAASLAGQLGALGPMAAMAQKDLGLKNPNDIYIGMLRSRSTADALIRRFDLLRVYRDHKLSDAREDLEKASSIVLGKEGFLGISVEDQDRSRAPQMANAYVDELRRLTQDLAVTEAGQRRIFFERQLELAKNHLADAEQALKETEQRTGLIQLDGQAKAIIDSVVKVRAAIAAKEVELHALRLSSTDQNPDVRLADRQLSGMRAQLALMEKQSRFRGDAANQIEVSGGDLPSGNVPEAGLLYVRKLREVKYAETLFELLAKQYEAARLDEAKTAAVIQVLDPAIAPDRKSSPHRTLIVAVAALLGLIGSAGYVLAAEAWRRLRLDPGLNLRLTTLKSVFVSRI
jgi:tyrosine-protein kinase Etk/Wzc